MKITATAFRWMADSEGEWLMIRSPKARRALEALREGKTYDKLTFDFSKLRGKDVLAIMREIRMAGITVASRTFDVEYQYRYAARCCEPRIGSDVIAALPAKEFERICTRVQRFLLRSAL